MSWLDDLNANTVYNYKMENGTIVRGTAKQLSELSGTTVHGDPGETISIEGVTASYAGFEPNKIHTRTAVEFEKNGRKALAIRERDGSMRYVSKTRAEFQKTGKVESKYSDAYQAEIEKNIQRELQAAQFQKKNQKDPMKEMLKNLADGEYVSDGVNFMRADGYEEQIKSAKPTKKESSNVN
jgi:hypothetical protein